ncbi:MAG: ROK family protein [Planctomycetota bacterium]|jgi:glucokinase
MTTLAFDIGGTHLRSAFVDADGRLSGRRDVETPTSSSQAFLEGLIREGRAQLDGASTPPDAVGLAMAGYTDTRTGRVYDSPSLGITDALVGPPLQEALGLPVRLVNDVNAAAVAEAQAAGVRDLVAILVGTGVGTGFVSGGELIEGVRGMAAEGGHAIWRAGGPTCSAGHSGCYQASLGGAALSRRAREVGLDVDASGLVEHWRAGDARATELMQEACEALAALCVLLVTLLDPERIVLAGGVALNTPELLEAARAAVDPHPLAPSAGPVTVLPARFGEDAGLLGAAILARRLASRAG